MSPRVTVAAAPSVAKRVDEVAALADEALPAVDWFAAMIGNPQRRYRIYLAGAQE